MNPERNVVALPRFEKMQRFGRNALAIAGVSLALLGAETSSTALAKKPAAHVIAAGSVDLPPPAFQPDTPPAYNMPNVGVATGSWNDDGLGYHTLFENVAAEGMNEVRLNYTGLKEMRAEVTSARANDIEPVISLPDTLSPQQAAQLATQLPRVDQFIIGNEVNSPLFSDLTPDQYVHLLAATTAAIHSARPDAQTRGFALASGYDPLGFLESSNQIAEQDFGGLQNIMDKLDIHLYRTLPKDLQMIQAYEEIYTGPIVIGELGWITGDPDHPGSVSPSEQVINEISFLNAAAQDPQIESALFFRYRANRSDPFDTANVAPDGLKRPAYYALQATLTER